MAAAKVAQRSPGAKSGDRISRSLTQPQRDAWSGSSSGTDRRRGSAAGSPLRRRARRCGSPAMGIACRRSRAGYLWVPRTSSTSCDQAVFVDHAADARVSSDTVLLKIDGRAGRVRPGAGGGGAVGPDDQPGCVAPGAGPAWFGRPLWEMVPADADGYLRPAAWTLRTCGGSWELGAGPVREAARPSRQGRARVGVRSSCLRSLSVVVGAFRSAASTAL
jgi:hypothetical protein